MPGYAKKGGALFANTETMINPDPYVRRMIDYELFDQAAAEEAAVGRFGDAGRDVGVPQQGEDISWPPINLSAEFLGELEPILEVTFLWRDGLNGPELRRYSYSTMDRAMDGVQYHGKVLEIGSLDKKFAQDNGLQRLVTTLRLRNEDQALNTIFRTYTGTYSIYKAKVLVKVGFRHLPTSEWMQFNGAIIVDKIIRVTPMMIELQLADDSGDVFGKFVSLLTHGRGAVGSSGNITSLNGGLILQPNVTMDQYSGTPDKTVPVPFGRVWCKATPLYIAPEECLILLGASKSPMAFGETRPLDISNRTAEFPWEIAEYISDFGAERQLGGVTGSTQMGPPHFRGMKRYIGPGESFPIGDDGHHINSKFFSIPMELYEYADPDGTQHFTTWYCSFFYINAWNPEQSDGAWLDGGGEYVRWFVYEMFRLAQNDRMFFRMPFGAEGAVLFQPWSGHHDVGSVFQEICYRYLKGGHDFNTIIDQESFRKYREQANLSRSPYDKDFEWPAGVVESVTKGGGLEILRALSAKADCDFWWGQQGRLKIRTRGITVEDLQIKIPNCRTYTDEYDIVKDSWEEWPSYGDDRFGLATNFEFNGLREESARSLDNVSVWFESDPSIYDVDEYGDLSRVTLIGRQIEATVDLSWEDTIDVISIKLTIEPYRSNMPGEERYEWRRLYSRLLSRTYQRWMCKFRLPLYGLELDLADYFRVQHYAGVQTDGGYTAVLYRVEGLTLDWNAKQIEVTAACFTDVDTQRPWVLDDENLLVRFSPSSYDDEIDLDSGSPGIVQYVGSHWPSPVVGDMFWINTGTNVLCGRVTVVDDPNERFTVHNPETNALLPFSTEIIIGVVSTWRIERGHTTYPTDADHPGMYPFGGSIYGRLGGERAGTGVDAQEFSNGDLGYYFYSE